MTDIKIADILHIDTPEYNPPYHSAVCVSDVYDFCFILSKNKNQLIDKYNFIAELDKSKYSWLDENRFVDCCTLLRFKGRNPKKKKNSVVEPKDIGCIYKGLIELRKKSDELDYDYQISLRRINEIVAELNQWSISNFNKPASDL